MNNGLRGRGGEETVIRPRFRLLDMNIYLLHNKGQFPLTKAYLVLFYSIKNAKDDGLQQVASLLTGVSRDHLYKVRPSVPQLIFGLPVPRDLTKNVRYSFKSINSSILAEMLEVN